MQNIKIIESNYPIDNSHYNTFQCKLPLDFFTVVPVDDPVTSFVEIMKGINTSKYFNCHHRGNRGYDPNMMLQVTLFAFINGQYELRKMEELCRYDIRYMWLASDETPSFMAFQRFISEKLSMSIEDIFYDVVKRIIELDDVDISKLYIDGTKIEANARKNSFVWKKAILGYQEKTFLKVTDLIIRLNDVVLCQEKVPYNYYAKKNTEEFKKKIYNQMNWEYDEKGFKVCPQGHSFNIEKEEKWNTAGEYLQISRVFECGKCHDCKVKEKCTKAKEQRKIQINYALNEMQDKVDENLRTEEGKEMKKQRSIQSEGTFGIIKQNMDYVRLKRRGNINVKTELLLIGIAYNIRKYHNKKMKKKEMSIS